MTYLSIGSSRPTTERGSWVAASAAVVGAVSLGHSVSVWYGAVLRGDAAPIRVGASTNVQDGAVLHADPGSPLSIGANVTVGHRALLHGCTIDDDVLIGMGAIVLNGAVVGSGSILGAGALIPEGEVIPPGSLVLGIPGRVVRGTTDEERKATLNNADHYRRLIPVHRHAVQVVPKTSL